MIEGKQVGRERESERTLGAKERDAREREQNAKERDEYNLPFTD